MSLGLCPITRLNARKFIAEHHRHNKPPSVNIFQIGVEDDGVLVGVLMAGIPRARKLMDGYTLELFRVCTNGTKNACSKLYGAGTRAAWALGYHRIVTYTLVSEDGASLRASGWQLDQAILTHNSRGWGSRGAARGQVTNLFGEVTVPTEPKYRWWKTMDRGNR